jgi:PAS domain S-box-containing protein
MACGGVSRARVLVGAAPPVPGPGRAWYESPVLRLPAWGPARRWKQYAAALAGVAAVTALRLPFEGWLQGRAPYVLFFIPILGAAWFCGVGPTVFATVLSVLAAWYIVLPHARSFDLPDTGHRPSVVLFLVAASAVILLARAAARARRAAVDALEAAARAQRAANATVWDWSHLAPIVHAEDRARIERILARALETGKGFRLEFRVRDSGGADRWLAAACDVVPGEAPGTDRVAGLTLDITERKQTEQALAEQREQFRVTLSSIGDAVITCDRAGRITFMNPVAEALTGWRSSEAVGKPLDHVFRIINEDSRLPISNPCDKVLRTGHVVGMANHTALLARDGSERPIADTAAPIIDDQHKILGVVLVFRDVSEDRRKELEHRAAERDREQLLESERAARAEAERATRLKDDFVATLSHELRTPLNAILGWTQLLRRGRGASAASLTRGLEVIERNTRLQAQLISDLLDVSRIVSGKLRLELELVDLAAVIDAAMETVRASAEAKAVEIRKVVDPAVPPLVGDHARLQQIVWNLLSNAIKFSQQGGVVTVTLSRQDVAAVLSVSDTGIGIKPEFVPFLFDRFRQADSSTTRRFGGLGLGLAIVKQLTELHNGVVAAESPGEGQGATFVVRLPLGVAREEAASERAGAGRDQVVAASDRLDGITVLIVEDDEDTRELVNRLLSESGARVLTADSAPAALERFQAESPDILISDIGLPGEDGYSLIARIRGLDGASGTSVPAIALTAFARSEDRTRALQAGFQAHLAKPVEPLELVATVASFAKMNRAGKRSLQTVTPPPSPLPDGEEVTADSDPSPEPSPRGR